MNFVTFILAILLASIHILAYRWENITSIPRSAWLSFGGGISVSYVFLRILPELHVGHHTLNESYSISFTQNLIFLLALTGLVIFYGLETMARRSKNEDNTYVFWLHISSFALYNMMLGHLLHFNDHGNLQKTLFFFVAIAAHFLVNDFGLQETYKKLYGKEGRWILALSIITGWAIGLFTQFNEGPLAILLAILSGSIILNVLKEELPEERSSRFSAFLFGVVFYSISLILAD